MALLDKEKSMYNKKAHQKNFLEIIFHIKFLIWTIGFIFITGIESMCNFLLPEEILKLHIDCRDSAAASPPKISHQPAETNSFWPMFGQK